MAVRLSVDDWVEIYAALESMAKDVRSGVYDFPLSARVDLVEMGSGAGDGGPDLDAAANLAQARREHEVHEAQERRRWVAHLQSIMTRIGPDGDAAATQGVAGAAP